VQRIWTAVLATGVIGGAILSLLAYPAVTILLGRDYLELAAPLRLMGWCVVPATASLLLRGFLDSAAAFSPMVGLNLASVAAAAAGLLTLQALGRLDLLTTSAAVAAAWWLQLAMMQRLLRRRFGCRWVDGESLREILGRVGKGLGRAR
jgi:O-antigen/teichoic acid export membrane protein